MACWQTWNYLVIVSDWEQILILFLLSCPPLRLLSVPIRSEIVSFSTASAKFLLHGHFLSPSQYCSYLNLNSMRAPYLFSPWTPLSLLGRLVEHLTKYMQPLIKAKQNKTKTPGLPFHRGFVIVFVPVLFHHMLSFSIWTSASTKKDLVKFYFCQISQAKCNSIS